MMSGTKDRPSTEEKQEIHKNNNSLTYFRTPVPHQAGSQAASQTTVFFHVHAGPQGLSSRVTARGRGQLVVEFAQPRRCEHRSRRPGPAACWRQQKPGSTAAACCLCCCCWAADAAAVDPIRSSRSTTTTSRQQRLITAGGATTSSCIQRAGGAGSRLAAKSGCHRATTYVLLVDAGCV